MRDAEISLNHVPIVIKQLDGSARPVVLRHMLSLTPDDLRMRFGGPQSEASVHAYVSRVDFTRDAVFAVFDHDLEVVGMTHVGMGDEAEFGVSVRPSHRGRGIGTALFGRAEEHARNHHIRTFYVHTLTENRPMLAIARKRKMRIITEASEAECYLKLPPPDIASVTSEFLHDRVALFDYALKAQVHAAVTLARAFLPLGTAPASSS
jgi:GNAT superfamily N-acetyltransferase